MGPIWIALAVALSAATPAAVTPEDAVMAPIKHFINSFNQGNTAAAAAACLDDMSILDEFAPYEWHGVSTFENWAAAYDADAKKNAITDGVVTLGKQSHVDIDGNHAYVVTLVDYAFKKAGKPVKETGSTLVVTLQKGEGGWRISGWSWAKK